MKRTSPSQPDQTRKTKRNKWSDRELLDLTTAIQKYGFKDYEKIAEFVKTKDIMDVKIYILDQMRKTRNRLSATKQQKKHYRSTLTPEEAKNIPAIRKWAKIAQNQMLPQFRRLDYSRIILQNVCQTFSKEAEESKHPGVADVKAIYKYMLDCLSGTVPPELPPVESALVLMLLKQLKEMTMILDKEKDFIRNFRHATTFFPFQMKDEYKKMNIDLPQQGVPVEEEMYNVLSRHRKVVQSFNPLQVYMWLLEEEQKYVHQMFMAE